MCSPHIAPMGVETQERTSIRNRFDDRIDVCSSANILQKDRLSWRLFSKQPDPNDFWFLAWDVTIQARVNCARPQVRQIATGEEDMKHDLPEDSAGEMANAVARLSGLIKQARLDCECRSELDETLSRFATLEIGAAARERLTNARHQRAHIETILLFLQDLDEIGVAEGDRSVYLDLALLFDDIATIAKAGALSMRQLGQFAALTAVGR